MRALVPTTLLGLLLLGGCAARPAGPESARSAVSSVNAWDAPSLERAVTVLDGHTGEVVPFNDMLVRLAAADVVFLGETHTDETTHRVELGVYKGLVQKRDVVLAMEMFDRGVQPLLDSYLAGEIDEEAFLGASRPWAQYRSAYRPLIEHAKAEGLPVVASNIPRSLTRRIAMEGLGVLDTLGPDERAQAPAVVMPNTPAYWRRVDNAVRGHIGMMSMSGAGDQRLTSTQTLWDNTMGESCAIALDEHPGSLVLHVNGGFHSKYWDGTVHQLRLRKPGAKVLTVDIRPTRNPSVAGIGDRPASDFVVYAETRATDLNEGTWTVTLDRSLRYRLHLPEHASDQNPVPLLIWLGDDGLTSQDGLDLWTGRLGGEAALAVLEPPYRERMGDQSEGGRWFWADSFGDDVGSLADATSRVWAYIMRHYPIDPTRVVLAGEGSGATVVAAAALFGDSMEPDAFAFEPRQYAQLKDFPLPLDPEGNAEERDTSLVVVGAPTDESWWSGELDSYRDAGLRTDLRIVENPTTNRDAVQESALREALGLAEEADRADTSPTTLIAPADTPRAMHWARLYALRHADSTGRSVSVLPAGSTGEASLDLAGLITAEGVRDLIPRCPGPFGGTTVLVLPETATPDEVAAWMELEENDPLNAKSRFHRVRIARTDAGAGDRALPVLLSTLESQNRKNILIVPASFYASPETMRGLSRMSRDASDRMTLHWLPGFGGELAAELVAD